MIAIATADVLQALAYNDLFEVATLWATSDGNEKERGRKFSGDRPTDQ